MLILLLLISWGLLLIATVWGILIHQDKQVVKALIICRCLYLVILVLEVLLGFQQFAHHPGLVSASFILTVVAVSLIDITFQRKFMGLLSIAVAGATLISIVIAIGLLIPFS
ncbi:DUF1516 family protein [Fructilactobacillus ixorae]|uniref:DUF1516 family protein n=1 Tax=Fructilactobacillus ixorae TaxID=1750535 RepID=A0ABY5C5H4_9LACO|nr:DUF1516 family protein [Fructilactobacillus ixorae]USS93807.1 DUF1516 family protein [Fructilactobacillus ixorae]